MKLHVLYCGFLDEKPLKENGIIVKRIGRSRSALYFAVFKWAILSWNSLRYGLQEKIDVFINANYHVNFLYVALAARLLRRKPIARVTGDILAFTPGNWLKKINRKIKRIKERISLFLAHDAVVLSQSLKRGLVDRGISPARLCVIPQGVDTGLFQFHAQKQSKAIRLIFVGRVTKTKGVRQALTAFNMLAEIAAGEAVEHYRQAGLEAGFDVYGDGDERRALENEWGNHPRVHFHGHLTSRGMADVYKTADILVLPSFSEGLPNVVMEAMAAGTVVIASNVGGVPELLDNGDCGLMVNPGNVEELADAMWTLIRHPERREALAVKARNRVETLYSLNRVRKDFRILLQTPSFNSNPFNWKAEK